MKYFTKELWQSAQEPGKLVEYDRNWREADTAYRAQLAMLAPRLNEGVYQFFSEADVHDGELLALQIEDGSRPAPADAPNRPWKRSQQYPVTIRLSVLDSYGKDVWELYYKLIRRVVIDYPSSDPLFYQTGEGFGDWGYHELTDAGDGFLRHEVLFATGAILLFEFKEVEVSRSCRSERKAERD